MERNWNRFVSSCTPTREGEEGGEGKREKKMLHARHHYSTLLAFFFSPLSLPFTRRGLKSHSLLSLSFHLSIGTHLSLSFSFLMGGGEGGCWGADSSGKPRDGGDKTPTDYNSNQCLLLLPLPNDTALLPPSFLPSLSLSPG